LVLCIVAITASGELVFHLFAAKQQLEARQAANERKRQERRRYLLGSFLLERLGQEGLWRQLVCAELSAFLKEERDRSCSPSCSATYLATATPAVSRRSLPRPTRWTQHLPACRSEERRTR
jgi:hypothetical protein